MNVHEAYNQLSAGVGSEIYYIGDRANLDGFGKITDEHHDKWHRTCTSFEPSLDIELDDGRVMLGISPLNFFGGGRRFMLRTEYVEKRKSAIAEMKKAIRYGA